jgi:hypothetical protein
MDNLKDLQFRGQQAAIAKQPKTGFRLPRIGDPPVMIGVPSGDMVHADFTFGLTMLFGHTLAAGVPLGVTNIKGTLIDHVRNNIVKETQKNKCSHLLFIDTDMAFKEDALLWLLKQDKDIIGVTYCSRRPPFVLVHHNLETYDDGEKKTYIDPMWNVRKLEQNESKYKVAGLPCGFMLIKMSVFDKLEYPYFVSDFRREEGEDIYFCRAARDAGFDIWLDVDLSRNVRHCGQHYYALEDAKPANLKGEYL